MFAAFIWYAFIVVCGEERIQNDRGGIWRGNAAEKEKYQRKRNSWAVWNVIYIEKQSFL